MPYAACSFSIKVGQLAGNYFLTLIAGTEKLRDLRRSILWGGRSRDSFQIGELRSFRENSEEFSANPFR